MAFYKKWRTKPDSDDELSDDGTTFRTKNGSDNEHINLYLGDFSDDDETIFRTKAGSDNEYIELDLDDVSDDCDDTLASSDYEQVDLDKDDLSDDYIRIANDQIINNWSNRSKNSPDAEEVDLAVADWGPPPPPFDESPTVDIRQFGSPVNKYSNGKIYKIFDKKDAAKFYIGSTCDSLTKRFDEHKAHAKKYVDRKVYAYFNDVGWSRSDIVLLQNYICSSEPELLEREGLFIRKYRAPLNSLKFIAVSADDKSFGYFLKRTRKRTGKSRNHPPRPRNVQPSVVPPSIKTIDEARAAVFALNDLMFKYVMSSK
jgi:hypothetical protein